MIEVFTDEERQLLAAMVLHTWTRIRDNPDSETMLARIVARLSGTDTVLYVSRAYPSAAAAAGEGGITGA